MLLVTSFLLGAATEAGPGRGAPDRTPLLGTSASAREALELVLGDTGSATLAGTRTDVPLIDGALGDVEAALEPGTRAGLDDGSIPDGSPSLGPAPQDGSRGRRCSQVVAVAARSAPLDVDAYEQEAVRLACLAAEGRPLDAARRLALEQGASEAELVEQGSFARAEALLRDLAERPSALRTRVVALEARVVAGVRTRSAVRVRLEAAAGTPAPEGQLVRAAYPGGSLAGRTGPDGVVLLDLPDVALDDELPLFVSWRGSAGPGTRVGPVGLPYPEGQDGAPGLPDVEEYAAFAGWLREALPYRLDVVVRREAAP